jgi:hypothetical protein
MLGVQQVRFISSSEPLESKLSRDATCVKGYPCSQARLLNIIYIK